MEEIDKRFVQMYQKIGNLYGMSDILVKLMATLYLETEEIAMDELARKTGYSLASISNNVKMLEAMGALRRTHKPGSKKLYLYMEKDFRRIWKEALIKKQQIVFNTVKECMPGIIDEYRQKAKNDRHRNKLKILEGYYNQILALDKAVEDMIEQIEKI